MVVTVFWRPTWYVPVISVTVLCVAVMFLLCCFCFQKKRNETSKISAPRKFLSISNTSLNKLRIFRKNDSSKNDTRINIREKLGSETDLLDSDDFSKRFSGSRLRIDDVGPEDSNSSCSGDSKFTFYSTYPGHARSGSTLSDITVYNSAKNSYTQIPPNSQKLFVA